jgi:hypothetical protein
MISPILPGSGHIDDEFHIPTSDDVEWTETCWFTFSIPERNISVQFYPYFRPNSCRRRWIRSTATTKRQMSTCRICQELLVICRCRPHHSALRLDNGIRGYPEIDITSRYRPRLLTTGWGDLHIELDVRCLNARSLHPISTRLTRATGLITLDGETIAVDCVGFRDRSWGAR